jgi:hypothetical protein
VTFRPLDWLRRVRDATELDAEATLVLVALGLRADERGECWPSLEQILADTRLGRSTVIRRLKSLEAAGWVSVSRTGRSSVYRMVDRHIDPTGSNAASGSPGTPQRSGGDLRRPPETPLTYQPDTSEVSPGHLASGNAQGTAQLTAEGRRAREGQNRSGGNRRQPDAALPETFDAELRPRLVRWAVATLNVSATWADQRLSVMQEKCKAHGYVYRDWEAAAKGWLIDDAAKDTQREARTDPPGARAHREQQEETRRRPELRILPPSAEPSDVVSGAEFETFLRGAPPS